MSADDSKENISLFRHLSNYTRSVQIESLAEVNVKPKSFVRDDIEEIDGGLLDKSVNIRSNVKILVLKKLDTLSAIWSQPEFLCNLQTSQIFVIIVQLNHSFDENEMQVALDKIARPIILQMEMSNATRLFFKNKHLQEVKIDDSCDDSLSKHFDFNFVCNLLHSEPEKFGKFSFDLMEMEIYTDACFKGKRLIDMAVECGDMLMLKFLLLFQPDIAAFNEQNERILEIAVENGNLEIFKAVLEIPVDAEYFEAYLGPDKRNALHLMTAEDLSLLMLAARSGRNEIIRFLLKCGLNVNHLNEQNQAACDFAWDNQHYGSVIELLKADGPFPYEFDLDVLSDDSELLKINEERNTLHEQIRNNQMDDVKTFVELNPEFRCAYDYGNQCALVTALESGNFEIYSFLRSKGFTSGIDGDHETMLAKMMTDNTYHELLEADSPFPHDFDLAQISADSKLRKISEKRDLLHEQIGNNQMVAVKMFIAQNPYIKCAYDKSNQSALVTALQSKNLEIYSLLRSNGFHSGINDIGTILFSLTDTEKDDLKLLNRKYFSTNENSHIINLLLRSRLGFGSEQENFEKIQKFFETLNALAEVQPILKVVSLAKKLDIVFDFNQSGVGDMDPTQVFQHILVLGRTIYDKGNILIGAKGSGKEILATIAHEFTHYAMYLLYGNQGNPYYAIEDEGRKQEFQKVVDICEANKSANSVIENVFTYDQNEHALELVVRVPHLLAMHFQEQSQIAKVREDFKSLFTFFTDRVLHDCKREIPVMKAKEKIRDLNKMSDLQKEAEATKMFCDSSNINLDDVLQTSENILIRSPTPELVLHSFLNEFRKSKTRNVDSLHIFLKMDRLLDPKFEDMIADAFMSVTEPKMFVIDTEHATEFTKIKEFYNYDSMCSKVVTIVNSILPMEEDEENFRKYFPIQHHLKYDWSDLNEASQLKFLSSKVKFQDLEMPLSELLTVDSKILDELSLDEVLKLSKLQLKNFNEMSVSSKTKVFIKRKFADSLNQTANPLTAEDVIKLLMTEKSIILADDSGMGKTISALHFSTELKRQNPQSWVVFIDLELYTDHYYKDDDAPAPDEISPDFFGVKILKLTSRVEQKFFGHFYESGKVIFIIDGFDEISPVYKNCILEVLEAIQRSHNLLLVTTRTHLTKALINSLHSRIIKIQPFTTVDQVDCLVNFWVQSSNIAANDLDLKARLLLVKIQSNMTEEDFFGVPLHVRMLAEIYEKSDPTEDEISELNVFSLYQKFTTKKIDIWIQRRLSKDDNTILQTSDSLNITQIHQKLAIENFFTEDITEALMLPEIEESLTDELLARVGIVKIVSSGKFMFKHQSFSEFFLADFVLSNVTKKTLLSKLGELHQMFLEILNEERFEKVRSFMNGKLEMKEKLVVDVLSVKLEKSLDVEMNRKFLLNFVEENLKMMITFVLKTVNISKACKVSLLYQKSEEGNGALLYAAAYSNLSSFKQLWNCIENFLEEDESARLFTSTGFHEKNILLSALSSQNYEVLEEILNIASTRMNCESFKGLFMQEDKDKATALNSCANQLPIGFEILWKAAASRLGPEDLKDLLLLQNIYRRNALHEAVYMIGRTGCAEHLEVIYLIMQIIKELFTYEDKRKLLFAEDYARDTVLHCAAYFGDLKVFLLVWHIIKESLNRDDQKKLWLKKSSYNIFMRSIQRPDMHHTIANQVINLAIQILESEEIHKALTERNNLGESFISFAIGRRLIEQICHPEDFKWVRKQQIIYELSSVEMQSTGFNELNIVAQNLRQALQEDLTAEELKAALYAEVEEGDTAMHFSLEFGSRTLVDRIFELADSKLDTSERLELIRTTNPFGANILRRTYVHNSQGTMLSVCDFLMRQSDLVPDVKALFSKPDDLGHTFLTTAALLIHDYLLVVLNWFKGNSTHDELCNIFFEVNIRGVGYPACVT